MDYDQILPQLFVGSHPRRAADVDRLRQEAGVTAVLNLQTDEDFQRWNVNWKQLLDHYKACGIEAYRVPIRDFDAAELEARLPEAVRELDRLLASGHTVYLHCTAGSGRSPSVAIAYLVSRRGWDVDQAVSDLVERRSCSPNVEVIRLVTQGASGGEKADSKSK